MIVKMTEGSPIVPSESQILEIPIFPGGASPATHQLGSRTLQRITQYSYSQALTALKPRSNCQCPHVLVSDDDPFQNFYYETLFQRSISWEEILDGKESFRFELFSSGEDLVKKFNKLKACKCDRPLLIITDYNMGEKKLNGLEMIKILRRAGYKGALVLRTSEELEDLSKKHLDLEDMLESKTIDYYVEKNNFKKAKEVIQTLVKRMKH